MLMVVVKYTLYQTPLMANSTQHAPVNFLSLLTFSLRLSLAESPLTEESRLPVLSTASQRPSFQHVTSDGARDVMTFPLSFWNSLTFFLPQAYS
jgi:hypothetical protein